MNSLLTYALLGFFLVILLWLAYHIKEDNRANPLDLVTSPIDGRLSAAKIGQVVGLVAATWVVVTLAIKDTLSAEVFGLYLAYIGGVDAYGKYLRMKIRGKGETRVERQTTTTTIKPHPPELPKTEKDFE